MNFIVDFNDENNQECAPEDKYPPTYAEFCRNRKSAGAPIDINQHYENAARASQYYKEQIIQGQKDGLATEGEPIDVPFYDKANNQCSTPLSKAFFDAKTVNFIRCYISALFDEKYGLPLGLQPYNPTYLFMYRMYYDLSCDMCQSRGEGSNAFNTLINYTIQELEKRIYKNFSQQVGMLNFQQAATYSVQVPLPEYTKVTRKALDMSRFISGSLCD